MAKDSIWNDNLVNQLKDLYLNRDMTTVNIAKELGFTKNAIIGKIHRLQLNSLKENKSNKKKIKEEVKQEVKEEKKKVTIAKKIKPIFNEIVDTPFVVKEELPKNNISKVDVISSLISEIDTSISIDSFIKSDIQYNSEQKNKYKLSEIEFNMCVWPFGQDEFTFCGDKTVAGKSYCQDHLDLVYFVTKKIPKKKYAELGEGVEEEDEEEEEEELEIIE